MKKLIAILITITTLSIFSGSAVSALLSANTSYFYMAGVSPVSDVDADTATSGMASASVASSPAFVSASASMSDDGSLTLNTALGGGSNADEAIDINEHQANASSNWSMTISNPSAVDQQWGFDFQVPAGSLQVGGNSLGAGNPFFAHIAQSSYDVDIDLNGNNLWHSGASLDVNSVISLDSTLTKSGVDSGGSYIPGSGGGVYSWNAYIANIAFTVPAGVSWQLEFAAALNSGGDETSGFFGNSFLANGDMSGFGPGTLAQQAVPIPAAVWLFGSGLIGLVGMARRKKV